MPWDIVFDALSLSIYVPDRVPPVLSMTISKLDYTFINTGGVLFENRATIDSLLVEDETTVLFEGRGI
jgi:hypothetical protein